MRFIVDEFTGYESGANRVQVPADLMTQYADHLPERFTVVTERHVRFRPKISK